MGAQVFETAAQATPQQHQRDASRALLRAARLGAQQVRHSRADSPGEVSRRGRARRRRDVQLVPRAALLRRRRAPARSRRHRARSAAAPTCTSSCSRIRASGCSELARGPSVHLESTTGRAIIADGRVEVLEGRNPLEPYESSEPIVRAVEHLVSQPNAGDITIFGAYDGYEIVSFDDQIGAHGAAGGNQVHPVPDRAGASAARRAHASRTRATFTATS